MPLKKVFEDHKVEMFYTAQYMLGPTMMMKIGEILDLKKQNKILKTINKSLILNKKTK
mgnify:CR=1 FL=1